MSTRVPHLHVAANDSFTEERDVISRPRCVFIHALQPDSKDRTSEQPLPASRGAEST